MVMMTVYHQAQPPQQIDHLVLMRNAVDNEAVAMILFVRQHGKPTLVGLESGQAIVKPQEAGDDGLSFEGLYDTAISIREYRAMMQHKVTSVADLPPSIFEMLVGLETPTIPKVKLRLKAKDEHDIRKRLPALINESREFRMALLQALMTRMVEQCDVSFVHTGALRTDEATADTPDWEIVDPEAT
jgi:hypothetical protein